MPEKDKKENQFFAPLVNVAVGYPAIRKIIKKGENMSEVLEFAEKLKKLEEKIKDVEVEIQRLKLKQEKHHRENELNKAKWASLSEAVKPIFERTRKQLKAKAP